MKYALPSLLFVFVLILSACNPATPAQPTAVPTTETVPGSSAQPIQQDLARTDQQGAVVVEVTPINLDNPGQTLDFQVSLNTHSVDLSMDLAALARLSTDNGNSVQGISWDAPKGGHHVSGKLSFPATLNGKTFLDGATQLTLTIKNLDAPTRLFTWSLTK
jgi:hypothetical protein